MIYKTVFLYHMVFNKKIKLNPQVQGLQDKQTELSRFRISKKVIQRNLLSCKKIMVLYKTTKIK